MSIFFTSDTHFFHKQIIQYCNRPWASVEDMNAGLIDAWNGRVKPEDRVYFIGDFSFAGPVPSGTIFNALNGEKHLIKGNHDHKVATRLSWASVKDYDLITPEIEYQDDDGEMKKFKQPIVLCHFPFISWDRMMHGSWHLHGHCHGNLADSGAMRMDVGVDVTKYAPIRLDEVQTYMALRSVVPVDHHVPKP